jgi:hypothetical protein
LSFNEVKRVPVTVSIDAAMYAGLERRAKTMGDRPGDYVRKLVEAAYLARVGAERRWPSTDHELDQAVRAVFCLAGEFDTRVISRVTGFSQELVDNALRGSRTVAAERRGAKVLALPAPERRPPPADRTLRVRDANRHAFSPADRMTIARMWGEGASAAEIGAAVNTDADRIRIFAGNHRDLCPARKARSA